MQWLGFHASNAEGSGSSPGQGTKIPQAMSWGQKTNKPTQQTFLASFQTQTFKGFAKLWNHILTKNFVL